MELAQPWLEDPEKITLILYSLVPYLCLQVVA